MPERWWRLSFIGLNIAFALFGVWAVLRPPQTDVIFVSWWPETIGVATITVLIPGLSVVALMQPANRVLVWIAFALNVAVAGTEMVRFIGDGWYGLRSLLVYTSVPALTCVTLWRLRRLRRESPLRKGH